MRAIYDDECPLDLSANIGIYDKESPWVKPNRPWFKKYPS